MHTNTHVNAILGGLIAHRDSAPMQWKFDGAWKTLAEESATAVGQMLLRENAESMAYRYSMKDLDSDADGGTRPLEYLEYLEQADRFVFTHHARTLTPLEGLRALNSFGYNACEHPEWEGSEAAAFINAAIHFLVLRLPGFWDADTSFIDDGDLGSPVQLLGAI